MKRWQIFGSTTLAVAIIVGAGYLGIRTATPRREASVEAAPVTVAVSRGAVNQTITAPGELSWTRTTNLSMRVGGQVTEVLVQPGDWAKAGDVLVRLEPDALRRAVRSAEQNLAIQEASLVELRNGASRENIAVATAVLDGVKASVANARAGLAGATSAMVKAELSRDALADAEATSDANLKGARATLISAQAQLTALLEGVDPDDVELARLSLEQTKNSRWYAQAQRDAVTGRSNTASYVKDQMEASVNIAEIAVRIAEIKYRQAQEGPTVEAIAGARATVASAEAQVTSAQSALDNIDDQVALAEATVSQANASVAQATAGLQQTEAAVSQAEASLAALLAGASVEQIAIAQARVTQAQISLEDARAKLGSATLAAPESGVVLNVHVSVGQTVANGASAVRLADPSALELYATIIEEDYTGIRVAQPIEVYFDALPDDAILGQIARIVPEKIPGERPLYAIYVALQETPPGLAQGMTADADIIIDRRDSVLRLPRALVQARSDGSAAIDLWRGNRKVMRTIQTGLRGDVYIEILDGLREGDLVVGR